MFQRQPILHQPSSRRSQAWIGGKVRSGSNWSGEATSLDMRGCDHRSASGFVGPKVREFETVHHGPDPGKRHGRTVVRRVLQLKIKPATLLSWYTFPWFNFGLMAPFGLWGRRKRSQKELGSNSICVSWKRSISHPKTVNGWKRTSLTVCRWGITTNYLVHFIYISRSLVLSAMVLRTKWSPTPTGRHLKHMHWDCFWWFNGYWFKTWFRIPRIPVVGFTKSLKASSTQVISSNFVPTDLG